MKNQSLPAKPARLPSYVRLLACCAALGLAPAAYAVCVPSPPLVACLADQPIQSTSVVKPNVMFVLDNSGSMDWDLMSVDSGTTENVNRTRACRKNHQYNTVYYNPNIDYTAAVPKNELNVSMGSQSFTAARTDPFRSATTINLSTSFCAVSLRCSAADASLDLRPQNAYYYKKIAGASGSSCDTTDANFVKVPVGSASCVVGGDVTSCPTGADERVNFANWYSYNRMRILMMKSGMSTAFSTIDDKIRVGFHTINNPSAGTSAGRSLNIDDFAATQKSNWYTALWSIAPSGGTPLRDALARAGNYYSFSGTRTGLSTTVDPVQYSCQKNFTILSTDGYWNGTGPTVGDRDGTVPASMPIRSGASSYVVADTGLTEGTNFPRPYYEGDTANSNTLADVAMYYWVRDLRTSGSVSANNVPVSASDPAYWQHMNTYTIGLGVDGTLSYPSDLTGLTSGAKDWPTVIAVESDRITTAEKLAPVDDLWHAAVNGRGQYYKATDPTSLANSLNAALRAVSDVPAYAVGPASSTNDFKSPGIGDYTTYVSSYRVINWSGDVQKFALDRATGLQTGAALWSAAKQLDSKVNTTGHTSRNIVTRNDVSGNAVDFAYPAAVSATTMSASQVTALCYKVSPGTGACVAADPSLVNYLRGDATYEGVYGVGASRFRDRHDASETTYFKRDLIGSIINAKPAYVAVEQQIYLDAGYDAFKTASKTRAPTLYVGANDGMLHALDAATGDELWAYVPSFVIPTATDENGKEKGLRALSYQDSGAPAYNHHFYLDGPLQVGAVDVSRTGAAPSSILASVPTNWKNILVGGLGKGGKGYYALDVTAPVTTAAPATMLADAKTKVLWEFPSAADASHDAVRSGGLMGYSYGRPVIVKTDRWGWVVMLSSGHNNSDGYGYIFVLNASTGTLLEMLKTPVPAPGMAYIEALVFYNNKFAKQVYGGDLNGNIWRFEFDGRMTDPLPPTQIFSSSTSTPITTEVNVAIDGNDGKRWIFFGTGQYLDVPDRATTGTQYLVALRDGTLATPAPAGPPVTLSTLILTASVTDLLIGTGVPSVPLGWTYALPNSGERNAFRPLADLRTVFFASLIPTTDPCSPGTTGNGYGLNYSNGKSRLMVSGTLIPYVHSDNGPPKIKIVRDGTGFGKTKGIFCKSDGTCVSADMDPGGLFSGTRHVGWRELLNEY